MAKKKCTTCKGDTGIHGIMYYQDKPFCSIGCHNIYAAKVKRANEKLQQKPKKPKKGGSFWSNLFS